MTKILHISTDYKPVGEAIGHGGVERLICWLAREQRRRGHDVRVVTLPGAECEGTLTWFPQDIQQVKKSDPQRYHRIHEEVARAINALVARESIDVVHDHMGVYMGGAFPQQLDRHVSLILSCYGLLDNIHYKQIYRAIPDIRGRLPLVKITVCSEAHARHFSGMFVPDYVVYHAVPERPLLDPLKPSLYVLHWSAVMPGKEQLRLALLSQRHHLRTLFAGPLARDTPALEQYSSDFLAHVCSVQDLDSLDPESAVARLTALLDEYPSVYMGEVLAPWLQDTIFANAERFVLCASHDEPFSLALLEAMAYGVPPVAGPFPSAREAMGNVGTFVESLDDASIHHALASPSTERSIVQAHARRSFGVGQWADRWDLVYNMVRQ